MGGVNEANLRLRIEQVEALTKITRLAQAASWYYETSGNDPLGELIQELAMDIARYDAGLHTSMTGKVQPV